MKLSSRLFAAADAVNIKKKGNSLSYSQAQAKLTRLFLIPFFAFFGKTFFFVDLKKKEK
jgi:hypothetical protein